MAVKKEKTLGQLQRAVVLAHAKLIIFAYEQGYEMSHGDGYRDPRVFGMVGSNTPNVYGNPASTHKSRLAHDFNLFRDGEYCETTEQHRPLGQFWEAYGRANDLPLHWGGHYGDGNHYSCVYQGRK